MCYAKPGPRCLSQSLYSLLSRHGMSATDVDVNVEEKCELLLTSQALSALASQVAETGDDTERALLLSTYKTAYLNYGRKLRMIGREPSAAHPQIGDIESIPMNRDALSLAQVASDLYRTPGSPLYTKAQEVYMQIAAKEWASSPGCDPKPAESTHGRHISQKDMSLPMLQRELRQIASEYEVGDQVKILDAAQLAAELHQDDVRHTPRRDNAGQTFSDTDPYIVHPLRNTVRVSRWGVDDANMLSASMLHDVVEDHAGDIASKYCGNSTSDPHEQRRLALGYVESQYGQQVREYVEGMSNPVMDSKNQDGRSAHEVYEDHVREEVLSSPQVFVLKFSDFVDNALSVHHEDVNRSTVRRSRKYAAVVPHLQEAFIKHEKELSGMLSAEGMAQVAQKLERAPRYLKQIIRTPISP